ncbi:phosphate acetyltransferase [Parathalassolituus penaei]|uniref:Phosphate acetyltransferase n=1 Tax=Parathalassolituus penaei TaxID=2997323 RepID=A0A9X3EA77_9GAMM|nr:phosphate acetyltransferase [Parathalassolituus penaei]MCY0963768.1 phosphate acetyltransferase [Parathalassolituus penaei]
MSNPIHVFVAPASAETGLTSISLGLLQFFDRRGLKAGFLKPVAVDHQQPERSTALVQAVRHLNPPAPMAFDQVQQRISAGLLDRVLEDVVALQDNVLQEQPDVVLVEGIVPDRTQPYSARLNQEIAKALDASLILVVNGEQPGDARLLHELELQLSLYLNLGVEVLGFVVNKCHPKLQVPANIKVQEHLIPCLGQIPFSQALLWPRTSDLLKPCHAHLLHTGDPDRRVQSICVGAASLNQTLPALNAGTLLITPADRSDLILAAALASSNGMPLAGLLLTDCHSKTIEPDALNHLCQPAFSSGLPVLCSEQSLACLTGRLQQHSSQVPVDDQPRILQIMNQVADHLFADTLLQTIGAPHPRHLSPAAFRYQIVSKARAASKRIVLPEGEEPRTVQAAINCQQRGIAHCILLGNPERIRQIASANGLDIPDGLQLLDPTTTRLQYVDSMVERRKHKQLTAQAALSQLEDNVVLGTMMLADNHVDGLVSGAIHTTANTIRPALQLIKTAPGAQLVSSVFFMGLPDQVLVYGDCAVNPDPNAEELADIAIQSADSALAMGIPARIAMISYSTGSSGSGADVDKVKVATQRVRERRPDLLVDGPLQYDAATTPDVAASKAPGSAVAGKATVLVFPDLNTGNTTYKAVQRSAHVISIGPMLQGLAKPVNDLSRGATVEDIIYTIALTAIQAGQSRNSPTPD